MRNGKAYSADQILDAMRAQFGNAVKSYWFYDGDLCPCCLKHRIDEASFKGKQTLSINAFMYREHGVLIAYLLCGQCAKNVMANSKSGPTEMHKSIEENLAKAYVKSLN